MSFVSLLSSWIVKLRCCSRSRTVLFVVMAAAALLFMIPVRFPPLTETESLRITDRNNILLREVFSQSGSRGMTVDPDHVSPEYLKVLLAVEDKRFYDHMGIDILAICKAVFINVGNRRIVRGASTITQQVVRNLYPSRRTVFSKIFEAFMALKLEMYFTKKEILRQYVNRISFGNNTCGIEAASRFYFHKSSRYLTISESAFLVSISQNPTQHNPFRKGFATQERRHAKILMQLLKKKIIDSAVYERALLEFPKLVVHRDYMKAPHFTEFVLSRTETASGTLTTTLDVPLQSAAEEIMHRCLSDNYSKNVTNASVLVVENSTGKIFAYAGSSDFWNTEHDGQVDGVQSLRQPGSTLKPFTYALALCNGMTAATVIADIPTFINTSGQVYVPQNYDKSFHGPVRIRTALGCSYNVPAVKIAVALGEDHLLRFYRTCGLRSLSKSSAEYGPGLTLGNGEVSLFELTQAYAMLARGGTAIPLRFLEHEHDNQHRLQEEQRILPRTTAAIVENILSDNDARAPAFGTVNLLKFPFSCSVKTGTTKDYKDNWTIGWTDRFTVGVWVGNFDASPMQNVSGISGAGPIFHEIMMKIEKLYGHPSTPSLLKDLVKKKICPLSGMSPSAFCPQSVEELFEKGKEHRAVCTYHTGDGVIYPPEYSSWLADHEIACAGRVVPLVQGGKNERKARIDFPEENAVFVIDAELDTLYQVVSFSFRVPDLHGIHLYIDDEKPVTVLNPYVWKWRLRGGLHTLRITSLTDTLTLDSVRFRVY